MAEGAVTALLGQVKDIVVEYRDLISGAETEFQQLVDELSLLKAIVKDVRGNKKKEHLFNELVRQVRDVVYEVEDTIDSCLMKAVEAKAKSSRRLSSFRSKRLNLAKEIKIVRTEKVLPLIEEAKKKFDKEFWDASIEDMEKDPRHIPKRDTPIRENRIVGFDGEEATIIGYLKQRNDGLHFIPIIGIPGQGKTTLAWKIYNNEDICYHFPIRIWVYISENFHMRDVCIQILKKFTIQDPSNMTIEELIRTVHMCLKNEKFLLVLDNVWSIDVFSQFKELLPFSSGDSKVLITSREMDVGYYSSDCSGPYTLRFLNEDESWTLLQYEVFGNLEDCPRELRGIGEIIAIKCDGVPLTIIVIGGILADQLMRSPSATMKDWETVMNHFSGTLNNSMAQRIRDVVALSYERLPDYLKECFVYLGVFPEDYEIPAQMLSWLWISEGFIFPMDGRSLEETADEMLNHLITQNLLAVDKRNHMGKVKTCRVHKMIRAFCIYKSDEDKTFQEIKFSSTGEMNLPASVVKELRRLCFSSDISTFLSESPCGPYVRSFLCFYEQPIQLEPQYISVIPDGFPKLRILESKSIKFHQFPAKVTKLIHLRYLTLFIDNLSILPEAILQLWNLQTLIVETKLSSITIKANIWKMIRLRHLKTKAAIVLDDKWEGDAGRNLQMLNMLSTESCTEAVSKRAKNLKTLGISGKLADIFGSNFLKQLDRLEKLKLVNSLTSYHHHLSLPELSCFPPYLKMLTLKNTNLDWKEMSILAMIKTLEVLKLKDNAFVGVLWNVAGYKFPCLQLLLILTTDLFLWEASTDSFPSLRFLVVKNCEKLKEIPECLGAHLQKLEIDRVRKSAVQSAMKIAEIKKENRKGKFSVQFDLRIGPACET